MTDAVLSNGGWTSRATVIDFTQDFTIDVVFRYDANTPNGSNHQFFALENATVGTDFLRLTIRAPDAGNPNSLRIAWKDTTSSATTTFVANSSLLGLWNYFQGSYSAGTGKITFYLFNEGTLGGASLVAGLGAQNFSPTDGGGAHPTSVSWWNNINDSPGGDSTEIANTTALARSFLAQTALSGANVLVSMGQRAMISAVTGVSYSLFAMTDPAHPETDTGSTASNATQHTGSGTWSTKTGAPSDWAGGGSVDSFPFGATRMQRHHTLLQMSPRAKSWKRENGSRIYSLPASM